MIGVEFLKLLTKSLSTHFLAKSFGWLEMLLPKKKANPYSVIEKSNHLLDAYSFMSPPPLNPTRALLPLTPFFPAGPSHVFSPLYINKHPSPTTHSSHTPLLTCLLTWLLLLILPIFSPHQVFETTQKQMCTLLFKSLLFHSPQTNRAQLIKHLVIIIIIIVLQFRNGIYCKRPRRWH